MDASCIAANENDFIRLAYTSYRKLFAYKTTVKFGAC